MQLISLYCVQNMAAHSITQAERVNALYVEVITPHWRHCLKSFRHDKDKYEVAKNRTFKPAVDLKFTKGVKVTIEGRRKNFCPYSEIRVKPLKLSITSSSTPADTTSNTISFSVLGPAGLNLRLCLLSVFKSIQDLHIPTAYPPSHESLSNVK